jgi:hypothetical protein
VTDENLDRNSFMTFVNQLRKALLSKDVVQLSPFLAVKRSELGRAYDFPVLELVDDDRELFQSLWADPAFDLEPLWQDNWVIDFWAGGRLIQIQKPDGSELLRTVYLPVEDIYYSLPLILTWVEGNWVLVR